MAPCAVLASGRAPAARRLANVRWLARRRSARGSFALALLLLLSTACALPRTILLGAFRIRVIDEETGRGIPAVELSTTDSRTFFTDSAGIVAFLEPDLLGKDVFFEVHSFGYRYEPEVLGVPGLTLSTGRGRSATIRMRREDVAERLYRVTGSGIYRDSRLLGDATPVCDPVADVVPMGMDSAQTAVYQGKLVWIWGDTRISSGPLPNFRATGARSELPDSGGLDPNLGIRLDYLRDERGLRPMVNDSHPIIWLTALRSAHDASGREWLFATYAKMGKKLFEVLEEGLAEFDDAIGAFRVLAPYARDVPVIPRGQVFRYSDDGRSYVYYDMYVRSPDDAESIRDLGRYEAFTPLRSGRAWNSGADALERDARGRLVWSWKTDAGPISPEQWNSLVTKGIVTARQRPYELIDIETGDTIMPHNGSVSWNAYRNRWIMIRSRAPGRDSFLGEVYYFEADTPLGPWAYGQRIITHTRSAPVDWSRSEPRETYTFYNPVQHPELDREGGRKVFIEGTLATTFAAPPTPPMPGYDYNQMMYRLDLGNPRVFLPVAIYRAADGGGSLYRTRAAEANRLAASGEPAMRKWNLAFFAPDRRRPGTIPVHEVASETGSGLRLIAGDGGSDASPVFYCAPPEDPAPPRTVPLYEERDTGGHWNYTLDRPAGPPSVLCRVWPAPVDFTPELRSLRIEAKPAAAPGPGPTP